MRYCPDAKKNTQILKISVLANEAENMKEVTLRLNCPCHTLITSSAITNPAFNSFEIKLVFFGHYDIYAQLEAIYGRVSFKIISL